MRQQAADEVYEYVGTISRIQVTAPTVSWLTIEWSRGTETVQADVVVAVSTSVTRNGVGVDRSELRAGTPATVWAEVSPYTGVMEATDIILGTNAPANAASTRVR
jgi:hypothetical protein